MQCQSSWTTLWLRSWVIALIWPALLLAGCGESKQLGTVTGSVRYRGDAVSEGIVSLYSPELAVGNEAAIRPDGSFSVGGLPFGPYRVAIHPPSIVQDFGGKSAASMEPKEVGNIPEKYRNPSTSGFTCDVASREVRIDLSME